jgi:predicted NUDIX family NTP pyrophosphohydrolase
MKKAISLLTSMMVMSLVAANMAVPATANSGNITYSIEDLTLTLDELKQYDTDASGENYIVPVQLTVENETSSEVTAAALSIDSDLSLYPKNGTSTAYAEAESNTGNVDLLLNPVDNAKGSTLVYTADTSASKQVATIYYKVPVDTTAGTYDISFDQDSAYVSNSDDYSIVDKSNINLKDGAITIADGMTVTTDDVTVECAGDALTEDTIVKVPMSLSGNIYLNSFTVEVEVGDGGEFVDDGKGGFVVEGGDLIESTELYTALGKNGKYYLQFENEDPSGWLESDGNLLYIEVKVPAGTAKGTQISVGIVDGSEDNFFTDGRDLSETTGVTVGKSVITIGDATGDSNTGDDDTVNSGMTVKTDDVELKVSGDEVTEDTVVKVPMSLEGNIYLNSFTVEVELGDGASFVSDGKGGFVVDGGDLIESTELYTAFGNNGKYYLQFENEDPAGWLESDGNLLYIEVTVPAGTKVGTEIPIGIVDGSDDNFFTDGRDLSEIKGVNVGGSVIKVTADDTVVDSGMTVKTDDVTLEVDGDTLAEDTIVKVPMSLEGNIYLNSFTVEVELGDGAEFVSDGKGGFVVDGGDLIDSTELYTAFGNNGKYYLQFENEDPAGWLESDGNLLYIEVKVPAGTKVGTEIPIGIVDGSDDNFFTDGRDLSEIKGVNVGGSTIKLVAAEKEEVSDMKVSFSDVEVEVDGDTLSEDIIVKVPLDLTNNIYLNSFTLQVEVGDGGEFVSDGKGGFVVDSGDLVDSTEVYTALGLDGNYYLQFENEDPAGWLESDGNLFYVEVLVPAGTSTSAKIPVNIVDNKDDNFFTDGRDLSESELSAHHLYS